MKHINYLHLLISISFLYALLITTSSPLTLQTQSWVYATEQEDNNQEETRTPSENEDDLDESNSDSKSSQGAADSDQSENNSNRNDNDDASSTDQNSNCPNVPEISNLPLYIGKDGCQYPCPSLDSNDQDNVPDGCPVEPSSQTNTGFSSLTENPTQTPSQEQQLNSHNNPNQNAFVSPSINSDTSTAVSNSEAPTTTTQKSFTPAGKLRSGLTQTESSIPLISNDVSKPKPSNSGNAEVEGTPLVPPSQMESSIPSLSLKDLAFLTVETNFTTDYKTPHFAEVCVHTSNPNEIKANPNCNSATLPSMFYTVQAPGLVGIKVNTNFDLVRSNCEFYINPKESKTCSVTFFDFKPKEEAKKERSFK